MSSYGSAIIVDVPNRATAHQALPQLETALEPIYGRFSALIPNPADEADPAITEHGDYVRLSVYLPGAVVDDVAKQAFHALGPGRAVIAEDADEFGVTFSVWELTATEPRQVYCTHVVEEPDPDLAPDNLRQGTQAATEAAALYNADPQPFLDIEADPTPVIDNLGFIGDPFDPWLDALGLQWPDSQ